MESGDIRDNQITASSVHVYHMYRAWAGRLYNKFCWIPGYSSDSWIQVDMLRLTIVAGIITQGCGNNDAWVKNIQIQYRDSTDTLVYILENGEPKVGTLILCLTCSSLFSFIA